MATFESQSIGLIGAPAAPQSPPRSISRAVAGRLGTRFAGLLSILAGLTLWELVSRFMVANALFLAAPTQISAGIYDLAKSGQLWPHIAISAAEFALGYVIASLLGILVGFAMASSDL